MEFWNLYFYLLNEKLHKGYYMATQRCKIYLRVLNIFQHKNTNFLSPSSDHVIFFLWCKIFTIFNNVCSNFLMISNHFPKIFQNLSKDQTNIFRRFPNIFWRLPKITEDCWRWLKKMIWRCFDHTPTNLSVVKKTKQKCYQKWYHYRFYHFVTTFLFFYHLVYH